MGRRTQATSTEETDRKINEERLEAKEAQEAAVPSNPPRVVIPPNQLLWTCLDVLQSVHPMT